MHFNIEEQTIVEEHKNKLLALCNENISLSEKADYYMKYGVKRRLLNLERICHFFLINPPEHLSQESHCVNSYAQINIYINALYIDIAGVLDNLAWCMNGHFEIDIIKRTNVSLFKDELFKRKDLKVIKSDLACHQE